MRRRENDEYTLYIFGRTLGGMQRDTAKEVATHVVTHTIAEAIEGTIGSLASALLHTSSLNEDEFSLETEEKIQQKIEASANKQ